MNSTVCEKSVEFDSEFSSLTGLYSEVSSLTGLYSEVSSLTGLIQSLVFLIISFPNILIEIKKIEFYLFLLNIRNVALINFKRVF